MKKNILTLMFVLASVCGGLLVSEVKASTNDDLILNSAKSSLFKKEVAALRCVNEGSACDNALDIAESSLSFANIVCNMKKWGSQECTDAVGRADAAVTNALNICTGPLIVQLLPKRSVEVAKKRGIDVG